MFAGIPSDAHDTLLEAVRAFVQNYRRGDILLRVGDTSNFFPIVLSGTIQAAAPRGVHNQIVARFGCGESFAEAIVVAGSRSPVDVSALTDSTILQLPAQRIASSKHPWAAQLNANLMHEMSKKLVHLSFRLNLLSEPRMRTRILLHLGILPPQQDGAIHLPFNRQEWADYLCVNSKALLRELRRMQDDRLLAIEKRRIRLLNID
ncbi:Crp/Fnr family transcriptional regulator [Luethyella okanaganae]|uniref:Crp/Fnr family transcriptional regulator n=1 Tax=Luethyella okanaganae TaxID=69372 RepID=A0ABW1VIL8_9MICO